MTSNLTQPIVQNLQECDVTRAYAVTCGDTFLCNKNVFVAFFTSTNVIVWPESGVAISVLNPALLQNLVSEKKFFRFDLYDAPKALRKTFLGIPLSFDVKAGLYPLNVLDTALARPKVQPVTSAHEISLGS